jgi:hypothetical protein
MNLQALNLALARAVGVTDTANVTCLTLTITPDDLPKVRVTRTLMTAEGLATAVEELRLRPEPDEDVVEVSAIGDSIARYVVGAKV